VSHPWLAALLASSSCSVIEGSSVTSNVLYSTPSSLARASKPSRSKPQNSLDSDVTDGDAVARRFAKRCEDVLDGGFGLWRQRVR